MGLGQIRVQFQRLAAGISGQLPLTLAAARVHEEKGPAVGDGRVGQGVVGVELDGPLVHLPGKFPVEAVELIEIFAAAQVEIVGFHIPGGHVLDRASLFGAEGDFQSFHDAFGDLVLDGEDILELAIVAFGPEPVAVMDIDELDGDAHPVAGLADASLHDLVNIEMLADLADVMIRALELEGRCATKEAEKPKEAETPKEAEKPKKTEISEVAEKPKDTKEDK